ncbi:MAG: diacylglycerol kinase family protein [Halobacteriaceae archaeon]
MFQGSRRLIINPVSGTGEHADYVSRRAEARGFDVVHTAGAGDGYQLAHEAVREGVVELAVCGGDGTVNEALRGVAAADALDTITFGVVPAGTANLLANNIGIRDLDHGLEVIDAGRTRTVDIGMADGEPFIVSCIAGFPAEASVAASSDLKERFGTLAFLVTGAREALEFDGLGIDLEAAPGPGPDQWSGEALAVLVGNARRFIEEGGQADMEDGRFDVAIVEQMPAIQAAGEAAIHRLLGQGTRGVTHLQAAELTIHNREPEPITFSRDGEVAEHEGLSLEIVPEGLELRVGRHYQPDPETPS